MNRDQYLEVLATEPVTPNQRGAIMHEFARLGITDRGERLAVCAALLELDKLGSTADLTQGQAGQLVNALQRVADRGELLQEANSRQGGHQHQDHDGASPAASGRMTWPQALARLIAVVYAGRRGDADADAPGTPGSPG